MQTRAPGLTALLIVGLLTGCQQQQKVGEQGTPTTEYVFERGFPTSDTAQKAYDDADLNRAVEAYRFFYPTVSGPALFKGNEKIGIIPNKVFGTLDSKPKHVGFTLNSDTPYAPLLLDLSQGPMVIELPPGPLICIAMDINQLWIADLGLPGPPPARETKSSSSLPAIKTNLPPDTASPTRPRTPCSSASARFPSVAMFPALSHASRRSRSTPSSPFPAGLRSHGSTSHRLRRTPRRSPGRTTSSTGMSWPRSSTTSRQSPLSLLLWPARRLGIEKGKPFNPDARMTGILEKAAKIGNAQMRVVSFDDRRPDRIVWPDRKWEWAALRYEDGDFNTANYGDLHAREKWFYQAIGASPAMFKRDPTAGSLYWLGAARHHRRDPRRR